MQSYYAAVSSYEECHEDDMVWLDTVVEKNADSHEACRSRTDLGIEQEDIGILGEGTVAHAGGEHDMEKKRFTGLLVGLDKQGADTDATYDSAQAFLKGSTTRREVKLLN